ncbi:NADH-quinone oxidoreductase subunit M [Candidatus Igneacidithiobacillus taiwanensis]|uniref:complex I subunit 4 family protein n=1 Tax=Candidatus Igneacidithiobacillus taiwanensis TaxID=1945924 RepID=UPI0028A23FF9|nr:NADH-quinone oxidoreductase subunit M [Candidatus Igneacidithiobacillus taiwanensis]MCE5359770.1 NADH-quinone oxidoreductase subunit M [Acidithiobacillus sp.]
MIVSLLILLPWAVALGLSLAGRAAWALSMAAALAEILLCLPLLAGNASVIAAIHLPLLGDLWDLQSSPLANLFALTTALLLPLSLSLERRQNNDLHLARILAVLQGALMGTFFANNFLSFYGFYEIVAVAAAWLILRSGAQDRRAALTFLLYTVTTSLFLLLAVLPVYLDSGSRTGFYDFSWLHLTGSTLAAPTQWLLFLAMVAGLGVKLPLFPLHGWARAAYVQSAPAAALFLSGATVLAGVYGLCHWAVPLLPGGALLFRPDGIVLASIGTLYGAFLALSTSDLRETIAYSSVSHMNLVALGLFALQEQAWSGALFLSIAHAILAGGLFALLAMLAARGLASNWEELGGLFRPLPRLGAWTLFFFLMALGLPGLGNFPGEFLTLLGSFQVSPLWAGIATLGMIINLVVFLRAYERSMLGHLNPRLPLAIADLDRHEYWIFLLLAVTSLYLGLHSQSLLADFTQLLPVHAPLVLGGAHGA